MAEFTVILVIAGVSKNIVNVIKMMIFKEKLGGMWLILSGVFGVLIGWVLFDAGVEINIFKIISEEVRTTLSISMLSGGIIGLVGQDIYKIMKLIGEKTAQIKRGTS